MATVGRISPQAKVAQIVKYCSPVDSASASIAKVAPTDHEDREDRGQVLLFAILSFGAAGPSGASSRRF